VYKKIKKHLAPGTKTPLNTGATAQQSSGGSTAAKLDFSELCAVSPGVQYTLPRRRVFSMGII